ncbi:CAP domain-containing protein [Streptomyces sp. NPDC056069]|uniref:CAP domain-containing protein n=1 Tax=Streptomyces sp. NPDC056069 TaxID=3345702 RepID=UPI0035DD0752
MSSRAAHGRRGHRAPRPPRAKAVVAGMGALAFAAACVAGAQLTGSTAGRAGSVALDTGVPGTPAAVPSTSDPAPALAPPILTTRSGTTPSPEAAPTTTSPSTTTDPTRPAQRPAPAQATSAAKKRTRAPAHDTGSRPAGSSEVDEVVRLVNVERAAAGCKALAVDADLTQAAQDYSDSMAATGNFSHTGTDGSQPQDRIEAAGYTWSRSGENIAKGQADAAAVVDAWMHSPGHRANILNCGFTEIGVGVTTDGGPWWTQDFGTPA